MFRGSACINVLQSIKSFIHRIVWYLFRQGWCKIGCERYCPTKVDTGQNQYDDTMPMTITQDSTHDPCAG